jgi:alpha-tubulin suppressor-like RCC1 family protein
VGKLTLLTLLAGIGLFTACNTTTLPSSAPSRALGVLTVNFDSGGVSTASLKPEVGTAALTLAENNVVFTPGTTLVISPDEPYDYLVASFPIVNSSPQPLNNLTLFALAKSSNVAGTAIVSISNFGGVTNSTEQTRLAKFLIPTQAVQASGGSVSIDNSKADFQAFTAAEVAEATAVAAPLLAGGQLLNYGFSARCVAPCIPNTRVLTPGGLGNVSIALRVPKAASSTTYKFVMSFVVMDDGVAQITRGLNPLESFSNLTTRAGLVSAGFQKQVGYNAVGAAAVPLIVPDVFTSTLSESIQALGIGRIDAGDKHSCGLTSAGKAYCWGANFNGELGDGSTTNSSSLPVAVSAPSGGSVLTFSSISAGANHTCGLTSAGSAYCWGSNIGGQLGDGSTTDSSVPVAVSAPSGGSTLTFSSITTGNNGLHSCGVTSTGTAYCWGLNSLGQLGDGSTTDSSVPVAVSAPSGGSVLTFSSISAGANHSCGLTSTGSAYCWGDNSLGQLGDGSTTPSSLPVALSAPSGGSVLTFSSIWVGNSHVCGLTITGLAYCWGANFTGQLGDGSTTASSLPVAVIAPSGGSVLTFSSITAGNSHSCGLTSTGTAYCWGSNGYGELGDGSATSSSMPVAVSAPSGGSTLTFSSITAGDIKSCGLTSTGTAYCWGSNSYGALGNGSTTNSSIPITVDSTNFKI